MQDLYVRRGILKAKAGQIQHIPTAYALVLLQGMQLGGEATATSELGCFAPTAAVPAPGGTAPPVVQVICKFPWSSGVWFALTLL